MYSDTHTHTHTHKHAHTHTHTHPQLVCLYCCHFKSILSISPSLHSCVVFCISTTPLSMFLLHPLPLLYMPSLSLSLSLSLALYVILSPCSPSVPPALEHYARQHIPRSSLFLHPLFSNSLNSPSSLSLFSCSFLSPVYL